jgi:hypothetical protein
MAIKDPEGGEGACHPNSDKIEPENRQYDLKWHGLHHRAGVQTMCAEANEEVVGRTLSNCLHENSSIWSMFTGSRSMAGRDIDLTLDLIISARHRYR